ncbi:hypothetical protein P8452_62055 [Trifolium repens]|nr:hypothetical protein P8452_62055 [Trifolium repens]
MIDSIRVKFPLSDDEHSDDVIERLISKGIAKGAKRIELLFAYDTCFVSNLKPFTFSFDMLLGTDSLTYLHLQNCCLVKPLDFSGLKNVRTLVLQLVRVKQNRLEGLFSNCIHLVDFTLDGSRREKNPHPFGPTITLQHIQNLAMILSTSQVAKVTEFLVKYRNLRQLELFIDGAYDPNMDYFWILDIAMASQHLQKLSVTVLVDGLMALMDVVGLNGILFMRI